MTFPRVHHADYFSDSGPVDGTVLVNSHSDAIEALQAETPTSGIGAPVTPGTTVGQVYYDTDNSMQVYVWDGAVWLFPNAYDSTAENWIVSSGSALTYLTNIQTVIGNGAPSITPPGPAIWFDRTTSPYTLYVYDTATVAWEMVPTTTALPYRTGGTFYYSPPFAQSGNLALTQNKAYATPYYVPVTTTFVSIGVVTTGTASATTRLGIYSDNNGVPGALVLDAGNIATATSGFKTITISQSLTKGWYWLTAAMQGAAGSLNCSGANQGVVTIGVTNPFSSGGLNGYSQTGVSGALPSPWGGTYTEESRTPIVYLAPA